MLQFPVKLTDPQTAILYITYDRQHMEDLKHAIHVKDIVEGQCSIDFYLFDVSSHIINVIMVMSLFISVRSHPLCLWNLH